MTVHERQADNTLVLTELVKVGTHPGIFVLSWKLNQYRTIYR